MDPPRSPVKTHKQNLPADVEEAVHALEEASKQGSEALAKKRFPSGLDPLLHEVARRAKAAHPLGHFSAALLERLSVFLPFGARTLKGHMKRLLQPKTEYSGSELLKEVDTASRALQLKVERTMQTLLSLMPSHSTQEASSDKIVFQWQEDTQALLCQIMSALDRWVRFENERRKKDKKDPLSARAERKKKAHELASFWPSPDWMTPDQLLRIYAQHKKTKKEKNRSKEPEGKSSPDADQNFESRSPLIFLE